MIEQLHEQKLDPEQALTLALIRRTAAPRDDRWRAEAARRSAEVNIERFYRLLLGQRLLVTLGPAFLDAGQTPQEWFESRFTTARDLARRRGLLHQGLTERATNTLGANGIDAVPLKGVTLAEALYGDLGARESSDVDLLVLPEKLDSAVHVLRGMGWSEPDFGATPGQLPQLHREMGHETLPPVELHWRVHWYEAEYSREALERASRTREGWLRLQPRDELAFLLLFLARDGLTGLRQAVDVAAWLAANQTASTATDIGAIARDHPALAAPLLVAARYAEEVARLPSGALMGPRLDLSRAQVAALRLANPWLTGSGKQIAAEVSLMDGLLGPPSDARAFARRQIILPTPVILKRKPDLVRASPGRVLAARTGHALRVLVRYGLAVRRLVGRSPRARARH